MNAPTLTKEELEQSSRATDQVLDEVLPIVDELQEQLDSEVVDVAFTLWVQMLHELFAAGWTKEELLAEVADHHAIHLRQQEGGSVQ